MASRRRMKGGNCNTYHEGGRRGRKRTMRGGDGYGFQLNQEGGIVGAPAGNWSKTDGTAPAPGGPTAASEKAADPFRGGRRRGSRRTRRVTKKKSVATIKRLLKAKGLKVSGSRRAVTARARKARIPLKGGGPVTGTVYGGFAGAGVEGMAIQGRYAHEVNNNVVTTDGGSLKTTGSGGAAEIA